MFAALTLETDFPTLQQVPSLIVGWLRLAGTMAMIVLVVCEVFRLVRNKGSSLFKGLSGRWSDKDESQAWKLRFYRFFLAIIPIAFLAAGICSAWANQSEQEDIQAARAWYSNVAFVVACSAALLAVSWEFLVDMPLLSGRRIWAIALLSMKEAIRRKALWSFCVLLAVFLFASWFIRTDNPEHQWRVYVQLVFFVMTGLLLVTASVLACFSLPTDIRQHTIQTVTTKPVQRFEIILGKIVGFSLLMSIVLLVMAHLSLLYVFRGIDESAKQNNMRARVPVFGQLSFEQLSEDQKWTQGQAVKVGREWEYRQYIRGGSAQEAVWRFADLPASLARSEQMIPVEFNFDIFRTSKGGEDYKEGVSCQISFVNPNKWDFTRYSRYREALLAKTSLEDKAQEVAREFGYHELRSPINVVDYKTYTIYFPSAVLEDLGGAPLEVRVGCRSTSQYLGVAQHDLYVLAREANFYLNFLKGTLGIWFVMVLLISLGVVFSTYLNALVSLMLTWMMVVGGTSRIRSFIQQVIASADAQNNPGGGPFEAGYRLIRRENMVTPLEQTRGVWLIQGFDDVFRFGFKGILAVLPDLGLYDRTMQVAEGFNIPGSELIASLILLATYLFPFLLLGYYLLNNREVAQY